MKMQEANNWTDAQNQQQEQSSRIRQSKGDLAKNNLTDAKGVNVKIT